MTATYGWIIERDHLDGNGDSHEEVGLMITPVIGPSDIFDPLLGMFLKDPEYGFKFRMYDGDGNLYFSGRLGLLYPAPVPTAADVVMNPGYPPVLIVQWPEVEEEACFGPLNDYGTPDSGCTEIRYLCSDGRWGSL